jgi:hypothetical protein
MIEPKVLRQMRLLYDAGWGTKRIAIEFGVAGNPLRRYVRSSLAEVRPGRRALGRAGEVACARPVHRPVCGDAVV